MRGVLDLGQRRRVVVRLGARRGHVDAQRPAVGAGHDDDRGAELLVRAHVALEPPGERARDGDAVAFDGDVEVDVPLSQQQVAHGAADEVHPARLRGHGLDLLEELVELQRREAARHVAGRLARRRDRGRAAAGGAGPRHHADHVLARRPRRRRRRARRAARAPIPAGSPRSRGRRARAGRRRPTRGTRAIMTALTGACPRPCPAARSRSASATVPARRSPSRTTSPSTSSRRQAIAAASTVSSMPTA